jgi:hypothetical protein
MPQSAQAQNSYASMPTIYDQTTAPSLGVADPCADGKFDNAALAARNAAAQDKVAKIVDITNQFPVLQASNACIEGIINALQKTASLADPFGMGGIVDTIIIGLINQACTSALQVINGVQNLIKNTFTICLPKPNLNLKLNTNINSSPCSGGIAFSPIAFTPTAAPSLSSSGKIFQVPHQ